MDNTPDLKHLFSPRGVAIVGASDDVRRIGGQPLHAMTEFGYRGAVFPVNPKYEQVKGIRCYPNVGALPEPCDIAIIVLPGPSVPAVIKECGAAGIPFAIILSAGFAEVGNDELEKELRDAIRISGVRTIGPNCTGMLNLKDRVFNGFGAGFRNPSLKSGPLAMVSQSGGFGYSIVSYAENQGVGFNYMVSTGNETDLTTLDVIAYLMEQSDVEMVFSYMEGIGDGQRLRRLGQRALQLRKPIVVWKVGNTKAGAKAALSHTANLTASYDLYKAAFNSGGFVEIAEMDHVVDVARAFRAQRFPAGNRVGVLTTSGGAGVLLADCCVEHGMDLPKPHDQTETELRKLTPAFAALENPMDLSATLAQQPAGFNAATEILVKDPHMDLAIIRSFPGHDTETWAQGLAQTVGATTKPVLVSMSGLVDRSSAAIKILEENTIPYFATPGRAAAAAGALSAFSAKVRRFTGSEPARAVAMQPLVFPPGVRTLSEREAKASLSMYGIPTVRELAIPLDRIEFVEETGFRFPLAVKIDSRDIPHKTEAGAVRIGIRSTSDLRKAAADVIASARRFSPQATIDGILVQEMASGVEVILGGVNDPVFGSYVVVGIGGVLAELIRDSTMRYAPFDTNAAIEMIDELKAGRVLRGYRGRPPCDVNALAEAMARLSWLMHDHADKIAEIDVNPLFVGSHGTGVVAADGLIVLKDPSRSH